MVCRRTASRRRVVNQERQRCCRMESERGTKRERQREREGRWVGVRVLDNARGEGRADTCHSDGDGLCRTAYTPTHGTRRNGLHPLRTSLRFKGTSTKKACTEEVPTSAAAAADESAMSGLPCGVSSESSPEQQARAQQQATIWRLRRPRHLHCPIEPKSIIRYPHTHFLPRRRAGAAQVQQRRAVTRGPRSPRRIDPSRARGSTFTK